MTYYVLQKNSQNLNGIYMIGILKTTREVNNSRLPVVGIVADDWKNNMPIAMCVQLPGFFAFGYSRL